MEVLIRLSVKLDPAIFGQSLFLRVILALHEPRFDLRDHVFVRVRKLGTRSDISVVLIRGVMAGLDLTFLDFPGMDLTGCSCLFCISGGFALHRFTLH